MFSLECKVLHFLLFEIALFNFLINDWNLPQNETFRGLHTNGIVFTYNVNHAAVFIHQFLILSLIVLWSINMSLLKNGLSYHCGHLFYYNTWIKRTWHYDLKNGLVSLWASILLYYLNHKRTRHHDHHQSSLLDLAFKLRDETWTMFTFHPRHLYRFLYITRRD